MCHGEASRGTARKKNSELKFENSNRGNPLQNFGIKSAFPDLVSLLTRILIFVYMTFDQS
jgi:hypothetical protein